MRSFAGEISLMHIYSDILASRAENRKLLAILLDPDKINWEKMELLITKICAAPATHIFIGGSHVASQRLDELVVEMKENCGLPVILFPGNPTQISPNAHGILFLSLLSGRNPDFLIGHHVSAAPILKNTKLEIIPTGYLLIESGGMTAVEFVSETQPMSTSDPDMIIHTAMAGEMLGMKMIYLEAGSGANNPVPAEIVTAVSQKINIPLIVGGGIKDLNGIEAAYDAGADMVVIGTAFENNYNFFN